MLVHATRPWAPTSGAVDGWPAGVNKERSRARQLCLGALANQDQACLIYREHTVDVSTRNGYFPWEAASRDGKII